MAAVDIKRGDMDKYHGSSAQEDSGDVFSKRKHFPGGYIADPVVCIN